MQHVDNYVFGESAVSGSPQWQHTVCGDVTEIAILLTTVAGINKENFNAEISAILQMLWGVNR